MGLLLRIPALPKTVQRDMLVLHRSSHLECGLPKAVGAGPLDDGGELQMKHLWIATGESVTTSLGGNLANWPSSVPTSQWALHSGCFCIV